MHGAAPTIIAPLLPLLLTAIIGWLNAWLRNQRNRRDQDKARHRNRAQAREVIHMVREFMAAYDSVSPEGAPDEVKHAASSYLAGAFLQLEHSLAPPPVQARVTFRQTIRSMLLQDRIETGAGKFFIAIYYASLSWALLVVTDSIYIALSQPTFVTILAVVIEIILVGMLPAWACRALAIHVDRRRARKGSPSAPPDLYGELLSQGSDGAGRETMREIPGAPRLAPCSQSQPRPTQPAFAAPV